MSMRLSTGLPAGLLCGSLVLAAPPAGHVDLAAGFARAQLGVDLSRYAFGGSVTSFPGLLPFHITPPPQRRASP